MQIKFYLNTQKKTRHGDHPVYMYITFEGKRIRKPVTDVHAKEKTWDENKERIRRLPKSTPFDEIESFNNRLDFIETQVKLIKQQAFDRRIRLTEKYILERLDDEDLLKADRYDFFTIVGLYMDSIKPMKAQRTLTGKQTIFNFLKDFEKAKSYKISLHKMDMEFFESLRKYVFEERVIIAKDGTVKDGTIEDNYFTKIIAVLRTFLNWAFERDYIKDQTYKKYKASERETEVICLTLDEFLRLYEHDFQSNRLNQVRDFFVFGCSTGLRFSDLVSLQSSNIQGDYIVKNIQKTRENSIIPLNKYSKAILKKYENSIHDVLPKVSQQKFNDYIKECCRAVSIDTPITITRFSGGRRKDMTFPKHQLITSHAARKTFTTLSLLMGVPERVVKSITGHRKEENFRRYVNFTKQFEKQQMDNAWDKIND